MGETAEKLESTLKKFKGTADLCYAAMRELHREIKKDRFGGSGRWPSPGGVLGRAAQNSNFTRLGLTDAALLELVSEERPLITVDFDLCVSSQGADRTDLWWNPKRPDEPSLWDSKILLSEAFEGLQGVHIERCALGLDLSGSRTATPR